MLRQRWATAVTPNELNRRLIHLHFVFCNRAPSSSHLSSPLTLHNAMSDPVPDESDILLSGPAPADPPASTPLIELDARTWRSQDDAYAALLPVVGAPSWHGHNLDALSDSLVAGSINARPRHFHIRVGTATGEMPQGDAPDLGLRQWCETVQEIFEEARMEGVPIWISFVRHEG